MTADVAHVKDEGVKEEEVTLNDLQQHLQLDAFDGKYLTKQEILLLELYQSFTSVRATHHHSLLSYDTHDAPLDLLTQVCVWIPYCVGRWKERIEWSAVGFELEWVIVGRGCER